MSNVGIESACVQCKAKKGIAVKKPGYNTPSVVAFKCECGWSGRLKVSRIVGKPHKMKVEAIPDGKG